ncbi:MAG: LutC/YkgG family protein [Actinomycetota bacterium]
MTDKAAFIGRVRERLGHLERSRIDLPSDWMPEIEDAPSRFELELTGVGGTFHSATKSTSHAVIEDILDGFDRPTVVLTREPAIPPGVPDAVSKAGGKLLWWPEAGREGTANATVGITAALWAVAETGTVLVSSAGPGGRAPSLVTQAHVAFVSADRLVPTVAELFRRIAEMPERPSNLVLVTGPSKTADIENQLVQGVHGPGEMHVVLIHED